MFEFNNNVRDYWERAMLWNSVKNHDRIEKEYKTGKAWFDPLPYVDSIPAVILGSGPSLTDNIPLLREWKGAVFASPSHVKLLDHVGRHPEFITCVDSSQSQYEKMIGPIYYKSTLLLSPCAPPDLIDYWTWEKRYFLPVDLQTEFTMKTLPTLYPWIQNNVINSGCVANSNILIANSMGYSPIITLGVDFGFPDNIERAVNFSYRAPYTYTYDPPKIIDPETDRTAGGKKYEYENGVLTTESNKFYKLIALGNWKGGKYTWYDGSNGIINEVPKVDFETVVCNQSVRNGKVKIDGLPKYPTKKEIENIVDEYTVPKGMYMHGDGGMIRGMESPENIEGVIKKAKERINFYEPIMKKWHKTENGEWTREERSK